MLFFTPMSRSGAIFCTCTGQSGQKDEYHINFHSPLPWSLSTAHCSFMKLTWALWVGKVINKLINNVARIDQCTLKSVATTFSCQISIHELSKWSMLTPMVGKSKSGFRFKYGFADFCQIRWIWIGKMLHPLNGYPGTRRVLVSGYPGSKMCARNSSRV